jgi:aminoglycoside 2''-phosphotransferase
MEAQEVRTRINVTFPEIEIVTVERLGAGWDAEAWLINEDLVFRFNFRGGLDDQLKKESSLLPELAAYLPVRVPVPRYTAYGGEKTQGFNGYDFLPGVGVQSVKLSADEMDALAADLARVLTALHTFPVEQARPLLGPIQPEVGQPWLYRERWRTEILPIFEAEERVAIEDRWDQLTKDMLIPEVRLIHADLGQDHILVDPATHRLTGVIDWGDATVGDPALDLAGMDLLLRRKVLARYEGPFDEGFAQRIELYNWQHALHHIGYGLYYGGGRAAVEEGTKELLASVGLD